MTTFGRAAALIRRLSRLWRNPETRYSAADIKDGDRDVIGLGGSKPDDCPRNMSIVPTGLWIDLEIP